MKTEPLRAFLRRKPFLPFEISLENGDRHEIRHPESVAVAVADDWIVVFFPEGGLVFFEAREVTSVRVMALNGRRK